MQDVSNWFAFIFLSVLCLFFNSHFSLVLHVLTYKKGSKYWVQSQHPLTQSFFTKELIFILSAGFFWRNQSENKAKNWQQRIGGGKTFKNYSILMHPSSFRTTQTSGLTSMYYIFSGMCPGTGCVPWVGLDTQLSAHYWAQLGAVSTEFISLS
jgi:hypothetical protein